jgi:hypothetical protein
MVKINSAICLLLVATLTIVSVFSIQPTYAQSIPKPSVPEFKIDYTNTVKVTHTEPYPSIDPYTGKTVYVGGGTSEYKVRQILIVITNQPFTPYVDKATYKQVGLFYSVQIKGHYAQNWATIEYWIKEAPAYNPRIPYQEQDYSSEYTTLRIANDFPDEGELDFRVQALEGWPVTHSTSDHIDLTVLQAIGAARKRLHYMRPHHQLTITRAFHQVLQFQSCPSLQYFLC